MTYPAEALGGRTDGRPSDRTDRAGLALGFSEERAHAAAAKRLAIGIDRGRMRLLQPAAVRSILPRLLPPLLMLPPLLLFLKSSAIVSAGEGEVCESHADCGRYHAGLYCTMNHECGVCEDDDERPCTEWGDSIDNSCAVCDDENYHPEPAELAPTPTEPEAAANPGGAYVSNPLNGHPQRISPVVPVDRRV